MREIVLVELAKHNNKCTVNQVEVCKLHDIFSEVSQGKKYLDHASFRRGLVLLRQYGLSDVIKTPFPNRLFEVLDVNHVRLHLVPACCTVPRFLLVTS